MQNNASLNATEAHHCEFSADPILSVLYFRRELALAKACFDRLFSAIAGNLHGPLGNYCKLRQRPTLGDMPGRMLLNPNSVFKAFVANLNRAVSQFAFGRSPCLAGAQQIAIDVFWERNTNGPGFATLWRMRQYPDIVACGFIGVPPSPRRKCSTGPKYLLLSAIAGVHLHKP